MQRRIAIFLLVLQLLTGMEFCQFLKLPVLVQHYREHKRGDKDLSLLAFLKTHYCVDDSKNADYARDQQLPFKAGTAIQVLMQQSSLPESRLVLEVTFLEINQDPVPRYTENLLSGLRTEIFQPPKVC
ncbi:hypothetical protein V9K67_15240 [Paraflavisolibacter sp. H34]|uniref:hypothetical protein n=1 Tax=Huijunlia imazamoxiresistens TaxID=3127457 RepID=UPI0030180A47